MRHGNKIPIPDIELLVQYSGMGHGRKVMGGRKIIAGEELCVSNQQI
ncbi:MAG: hypothetical protein HQ530_05645 [Parcubacteria group bacterium]|nr:hypothetical protein [Parcubacteria group bacterium]